MAINTLYLDRGIMKSAKSAYGSQYPKNIRLEKFFQSSVFSLLQKTLNNSIYKLKFEPYECRYFTTKAKAIDSFLNGRYFEDLIHNLLEIKKYRLEYEIRKFGPANYTLLHDEKKDAPGIDFILNLSNVGKTYGGYTVYLTETEELLQVNPIPNTLTFIERTKEIIKYTKYVTHRQKNPIIEVAGTVFEIR